MNLIAKAKSFPTLIKSWFGGPPSMEGCVRPAWGIGELGNWFRLDDLDGTGWQRNLSLPRLWNVPIRFACVSTIARGVALCPPLYRRLLPGGGFETVRDHWVPRLIRNPNDYQSWAQLIHAVIFEMVDRGESLLLIVRDERSVPVYLHWVPRDSWTLHWDRESKSVFYGLSESGNPLVPGDLSLLVPARDVVHLRQHTPRHPLIGESAIKAAALAIGIQVALSQSQAAFFSQMRRPSGIVSTDHALTREQITTLREAFDEQSKTWNNGGIPILSNGLKFQQLSLNSADSQVIETAKWTVEEIARVYGVPLPLVGSLENASLNNADAMIRFWLSLGLGPLLENIEQSLWKALRLSAGERIDFDTSALLRADPVARADATSKRIMAGNLTPNEARAQEGLPPVEGGENAFMQQQMRPVAELAQPLPVAPVTPAADPEPLDSESQKQIATAKSIGIEGQITQCMMAA